MLGVIDDSIVVARVSDVLYVAKGPAGHELGRRAAAALRGLARETRWEPIERAECVARALEIYAELNDQDGLHSSTAEAIEFVDSVLDSEHAGPPFVALRALIALKPRQRPDDFDVLLDRVTDHFEGSPHAAAACALAAEATGKPERRASMRRRELAAREREANGAKGVARASLLSKAVAFARRYGLTAEADRLLKQLQDMPHSELEFQSHQVSTEIATHEVRSTVDAIVGSGATDLGDALSNIGASIGPPGGSDADLDEEIRERNRQFPISQLFAQTIIGPESSAPQFTAVSEAEKLRAERGRTRRMYADYMGDVYLKQMFNSALELHGRADHGALTEHFDTELIGPVRGERIARALELFWDGDYDASAHVLVPRLESILRDLARECGVTIIRHAGPGEFGGILPLGTVLAKLRELDPHQEWLDYLTALLCEPLALNLRNAIAHGLLPRVGAAHAALLLHAASYLALLRPVGEGPEDDDHGESDEMDRG